jgi:putative Mn2+ efflux pump MntP
MDYLDIIFIAVGLSADAFAVSAVLGMSAARLNVKTVLAPGIYFGAFQALMPIIGYFLGGLFEKQIQAIDHWIAFVLLALIGAKMIKESGASSTLPGGGHLFSFKNMLVLAIATSIDALAVGLTFAFYDVKIFQASLIIGIITFCTSSAGSAAGHFFGSRFKSKAEIIGGLILITIGIKTLFGHL